MSIGAASIGGADTLGGIDVSTQAGALAALDVTDDAIEQILQGVAPASARGMRPWITRWTFP